ncbi:hypothetical protein DFJ73DRAFT_770272 [Zopfochytrium polystomum]|nr:hypothetical protein DFJ73DRAFT_770272 [Zopfochytrium polystomum]
MPLVAVVVVLLTAALPVVASPSLPNCPHTMQVKSELGAGRNGKTFTATTGFLGAQSVIKEQKRVPFTANELDAIKDNKIIRKAGENPTAHPNKVKMSDHIAQSVKNQQTKVGYAHNDLTFGNNIRVDAKKKDARGAPKVKLIDWGAASKLRDGKLSDFDNRSVDRTVQSLCNDFGLAFRSTAAGSRLFRRSTACFRGGGSGKGAAASAAGGRGGKTTAGGAAAAGRGGKNGAAGRGGGGKK